MNKTIEKEDQLQLYIQCGYEGIGLMHTIIDYLLSTEKKLYKSELKKRFQVGNKLMKVVDIMQNIGIINIENGEIFNNNVNFLKEKSKKNKEKISKKILLWRENQQNKKNVTSYNGGNNVGYKGVYKDGEKSLEIAIQTPKPPKKKEKIEPHLFSESQYCDYDRFEKQFEGTDYSYCDLRVYFEKVKNWSESSGAKKVNWIATAKNFMLKDKENNKLILKNGNKPAEIRNSKLESVFAEIDRMFADGK